VFAWFNRGKTKDYLSSVGEVVVAHSDGSDAFGSIGNMGCLRREAGSVDPGGCKGGV
jgi:hypothetical protein